MAKLLKLRRGTTTQHASFTGAEGEVTIDTTKDTAVVHDGSQAGGRPMAREDMSNVSSASIAGQLGTDSIATTKIAAGALPSDVTIDGTNITAGSIHNSDVNSSAAIAGTKISPDFGSQAITTTGDLTAGDGNFIKSANDTNFANKSAPATIHGVFTNNSQSTNGVFSAFTATANNASGTNQGASFIAQSVSGGTCPNIFITQRTSSNVQTTGLSIDTSQNVAIPNGNLAVTGNMTATGAVDAAGMTISAATPTLNFNDSNDNPDFRFLVNTNAFILEDTTNSAVRFKVNSDGHVDVTGNLDVGSGLDVTGEITSTGTNSINTSVDQKIILEGSTSPYIRFREGTTDKAYIQWDAGAGEFILVNQESGEYLRIGSGGTGLKYSYDGSHATVWHSGNDGAGSGLDADYIDGLHSAQFLRSDTGDQATGDISFAGGAGAVTIAGNSDIRFSSGTWSGETTKIQHHSGSLYVCYSNSGNLYFRDDGGTNNLTLSPSGDLTAVGNVTAYSDARLKTDISTINDALGICGKLRGVSYKWIATDKPSIGVIAQEVEEVIPEVVLTNVDTDPTTGETTEVKSVDYGKIVGVLINAINELKAELDTHKKTCCGGE